jgi:uncharacterized protein
MAAPTLHLSLPVDDLKSARAFYEDVLGCRIGRVRDRWFDVWFFGLQLTLALEPDEVRPGSEQGVRHFGVTFNSSEQFAALVGRIRDQGVSWIEEPTEHQSAELSGKLGGKLADPAGNVIELKYYSDPTVYQALEPATA